MQQSIESALAQHFGFASFRPGQGEASQHVLAGRDTLVVMPTGAGKSLVYQLPALLLPSTTLVISPLVALMKDQVDSLVARGKPATFINSSLTTDEQDRRMARLAGGAYKLVYVAPERLRSRAFLRALQQARVGRVAVDEAHCISQWGHDFRPDYLNLRQTIEQLGRPPVVALTATATPQVQDDIADQLGLRAPARIVTGFNRPNIVFEVHSTPDDAAKARALQALLDASPGSAIVYAGTRRAAEEVTAYLKGLGVTADYYHAGLETNARRDVQERFMRGEIRAITATNAFGMGVDKPDIRTVIHYTLPSTVEAYYQEAGRAGRDGAASRCILLYSPKDRALQEWFIENDAPNLHELRSLLSVLKRSAETRSSSVARVSDSYLVNATSLSDVKVRVGLSQLERVGAVVDLGDELGVRQIEVQPLAHNIDLADTYAEIERRRAHKRAQLARIVHYAEMNTCRRQFILDHFGDTSREAVERCCDTCLASTDSINATAPRATTTAEWTALVILQATATLSRGVGREKLAQLLKGSKAQALGGLTRHKLYGKLGHLTLSDLGHMIDQLITGGYLKLVGGDYPTLVVAPRGAAALRARAAISLTTPSGAPPRDPTDAPRTGDTVADTFTLFKAGLSAAEIAQRRELSERTVWGHLAQLITRGEIHVDRLVPPAVQDRIRAAIAVVGADRLTPIKERLPDNITFEAIRCVIASLNASTNNGALPAAQPSAAPGSSPPVPAGLAAPPPTETCSSNPPASPPPQDHTSDAPMRPASDNGLYEKLRALRTQLAHEERVAPFIILHDRHLREIAALCPASLDDLKRISGVGARKVEAYGSRILDVVRAHLSRSDDTSPK